LVTDDLALTSVVNILTAVMECGHVQTAKKCLINLGCFSTYGPVLEYSTKAFKNQHQYLGF